MKNFFKGKVYPNFKDIVILLGVFVISMLLSKLAVSLVSYFIGYPEGHRTLEITDDLLLSLAYILNFVLVIFFALIYRHQRAGLDDKPGSMLKRFKLVSPAYLLWGVILMVAASVVTEPVMCLFPKSMEKMYELMASMGWIMVLTSVFIAPILEELLFRGIVQGDITAKYGATTGIFVSAVIFGLLHGNTAQGVSAFCTGLVLGFVFYRTHSLWAVIFLHFINNALAQVLFIFMPGKDLYLESLRNIIGIDWIYYIIYGISLLLLIITVVKIIRLGQKNKNDENERSSQNIIGIENVEQNEESEILFSQKENRGEEVEQEGEKWRDVKF